MYYVDFEKTVHLYRLPYQLLNRAALQAVVIFHSNYSTVSVIQLESKNAI